MTTTGWQYEFIVVEAGKPVRKTGTIVGFDLDTEDQVCKELRVRWGHIIGEVTVRKTGGGGSE